MKNFILILLLLISANALCQSTIEKSTCDSLIFATRDSVKTAILDSIKKSKSETIVEQPKPVYHQSLLKLELKKNNSNVSRKINIEEDDVVTVVLKNVFKERAKEYYIKQVVVQDLSSAIKFGKTDLSFLTNDSLTEKYKITDTLPVTDVTFTISNLEQGKSYKYLVMYKDTIEDQFYVTVDEIIHFEINIGPVFSSLQNPDFKSFTATRDQNGNEDSVTIKDNGTNNQLNFVIAGVFRPWGYDPRANVSLKNFFIMLGIPLNKTLGEHFLFGCGFGARGINIVAGLHIGTKNRLADGFNLNTKYSSQDIDLEKIVTKEISFAYFAGLVLDLGIVGKLFSSIKL